MDLTLGRIRISGAALFALAAAFVFNIGGISAEILVALAVHELGHMAALRCMGIRLAEFRVELWGLTIRYEKQMSYAAEIITAAAGPAASLLLALASSFVGRLTDCESAYITAGISLVCGAFNLLPAMRLDGGRILYASAALRAGLDAAEKLLCVTSCIVIGGLLTAGAALLIWTRANFTLLLAAVWLLISYCKRNGLRIKSKGKTVGFI
jgi:stage IV sporulation protein FB